MFRQCSSGYLSVLPNESQTRHRCGVPDVAGGADPLSRIEHSIRREYGPLQVALAPLCLLWAGLIAIANQSLGLYQPGPLQGNRVS
jgi:hypothetical protein